MPHVLPVMAFAMSAGDGKKENCPEPDPKNRSLRAFSWHGKTVRTQQKIDLLFFQD
jgi:hypothetical protein